jgi:phytoene synthase
MQPGWFRSACATRADRADCNTLLRGGSRTFYAASLILPYSVRAPATALYAFCRLADDAVDLDGGRMEALARLRERLDRIYDGRPLSIAADCALADVVARFSIPRALPDALLEGFEWDATGRRYETLDQLLAYAARVAGSVGAMMSILMGAREPDVVSRACDLGVAMQLTNIARDVGEDARAGRLYLPLQFMREAGIDPDAWCARPVFSPALGSVIQRVLHTADALYASAAAGISRLPLGCQPGMHAARLLYAEIGREVERRGLDSVAQRACVPFSGKVRLLLHALAATIFMRNGGCAQELPATRYLVEAAAAVPHPTVTAGAVFHHVPWWNFRDRLVWVIHLFEQLELRQQLVSGRDAPDCERSQTALG